MRPLSDPFEEAERILSAAKGKNLVLRLMGGVAIGMRCPSIRGKGRSYRDLDFVATSGNGLQLEPLFEQLGYQADKMFNKLNGADRMLFWDDENSRRVDVLVDQLDMSHTIDLRHRLDSDERTLSLADLLLSKLQIFQISDRDLLDIAVLLIDHDLAEDDNHGINVPYLAGLCARDWGLYHTCQINLERLLTIDSSIVSELEVAMARAEQLSQRLSAAPKTLRWKLRNLVGERVQWYRLPEEIE